MAKSKQTLFEQYLQAQQAPEPNWWRSPLLRWSIIGGAVVVCALFMPQLARTIFHASSQNIPAVGLRWSGNSVIADYTFSVLKPPDVYQQECAAAEAAAPPVYEVVAPAGQRRGAAAPRSYLLTRWLDSLRRERTIVDTIVQTQSPHALLWEGGRLYRLVPRTQLLSKQELEQQFLRMLAALNVPDTVALQLRTLLDYVPIARYDSSRSALERSIARANVTRTYGIVRRGEVVVARGELITPAVLARLQSYYAAVAHEESLVSLPRRALIALFRSLLLSAILWLYLSFARSDYFADNRTVLTLAVLLCSSCMLSWSSTLLDPRLAPEFLVVLPALAMVTAIVYDVRLAFVFATSAALLHIAIRSSDMVSGLALLLASIAGAITLHSLQSRYQFARSALSIALGFALSLLVTLLENEITLDALAAPAVAAAINALLSPLVAYGVLVVLERGFNISTDLRLLELDSLTHPLLVKLRQLAPGTYQHTLNVALLAEHAALAVGANPLLARVGAYFHDIGKMRKPEYFAENQFDFENKHRHLSPLQSAEIIRSHVEDGIELALEYRLPPKVVEFIPTHHGTSLITHFYALALEEAKTTGEHISEDDFRYPGPKPRTKETGIVMLADVAEAIARTAETPEEIEQKLESVFRSKIDDGQLDECPLSLQEIATIRQLFAELLVGMIHGRPEYHEPPSVAAS